jgi:membrane associated rhomboid family serine protease
VIPLRDDNPTDRFPIVTVILIAINIAAFVWQLTSPTDRELNPIGSSGINQSSVEYGAIPYRITHPGDEQCFLGYIPQDGQQLGPAIACEGTPELAETERVAEDPQLAAQAQAEGVDLGPTPLDQAPWWVTILTSMFMHGGLLHIAGNMIFLWVFGNNVEDSMGRGKFVLFYLLAGAAAVYSQAALDTGSLVPTIGASGAVAGVLGAYALLYPRARVLTLIFIIFFVTFVEIPAFVLLGIWFVLQFLPAVGQFATPDLAGEGGVAYFAHVGGFIFGLALIKLFATRRREQPPPYPVY